jgi:glycosyltransferase involved in cell wall biosynthesis
MLRASRALRKLAAMTPRLSIVIPTHRRPEHLKRLLLSLCDQFTDTYEVIVVSNFAHPDTQKAVEQTRPRFRDLKYFVTGEKGVNKARNLGLSKSSGEIVYFLDDDCELIATDHLQRVLRAHETHAGALAVGGHYVLPFPSGSAASAYHQVALTWMSPDAEIPRASWKLVGGNVSYKRQLLSQSGCQFNPMIIFGGAETELHLRLAKSGYQAVILGTLAVRHHNQIGFLDLAKKALSQGISRAEVQINSIYSFDNESYTQTPRAFCVRIYHIFFNLGYSFRFKKQIAPGEFSVSLIAYCFLWFLLEVFVPDSLAPRAGSVPAPPTKVVRGILRQKFDSLRYISRNFYNTCHSATSSLFWSTRDFLVYRVSPWAYSQAVRHYFSARSFIIYKIGHGTRALISRAYWSMQTYLRYKLGHHIRSLASRAYWSTRTYLHYKLGHSIRNLAIRGYWSTRTFIIYRLGHGASHLARQAFWKTYDLHWKIRGPLTGLLHVIFAGDSNAKSAFHFLYFCILNFRVGGSKTTAYLHRRWRAKTRVIEQPSILVDICEVESASQRFSTAKDFGFRRVTVRLQKISDLSRCLQIIDKALELEFDVDLFLTPLTASCLELFADKACCIFLLVGAASLIENESLEQLTNVLQSIAKTPYLALEPASSCNELRNILSLAKRFGFEKLRLVDFLDRAEGCTIGNFKAMQEFADNADFDGLKLEIEQLHRPFDFNLNSTSRLKIGKVDYKTENLRVDDFEWSIIIPCFQNFEYLIAVINQIGTLDYNRALIQAVVVDDGSDVPVAAVLKERLSSLEATGIELKIVRLERRENGAFDNTFRAGIARNAGLIHAKGRKILFLDSDILLGKNYLNVLDKSFDKGDILQSVRLMLKREASSAGTTVDSISIKNDIYPESYYWENFKKFKSWDTHAAPWKYVCTYALAVKRDTLQKVGHLRSEFCEYGFEDTELGYRFYRHGFRFYLVQEPVFHLYPTAQSWNHHFDEAKRRRSLERMAQLFYRMHSDPSIFSELRSLMATDIPTGEKTLPELSV